MADAWAVKLSAIFGDQMVLQRNKPVSIWGKGAPGEKVTVTFGSIRMNTKVATDSSWKIQLPGQMAGGPHIIQVNGKNEIILHDVYFGEVWIASGQSNMELKLKQPVVNNTQEIANAHFPQIRYIDVKNMPKSTPQSDFETKGWNVCSPKTAGDFSAVAYFFSREVFQKINVPIGIIQCEWGGTPAEAWTSKEALKPFPEFNSAIADLVNAEAMQTHTPNFKKILAGFNESLLKNDAGTKGGWWKSELSPTESDWKPMTIPTVWEQAGLPGFDGAVWFRKEFNCSATLAKETGVILRLSTIDDMDSTWVNGVKVGGMRGYDRNRNYTLPEGVLKEGKNVVSIRVIDWSANGGLWGDRENIVVQSKTETLSLAGDWQYKVGCKATDLVNVGDDKRMQNMPSALYNGMLHPLLPLSIQGVIWYQGESNANKAKQYQALFPAMINDWRSRFNQGNFPFLFVQLANYMKAEDEPKESNWAELREAQTMTTSLPNTGMACIIDVGEAYDIHPRNKQDVGHRLAVLALKNTYGIDVPSQSPSLDKAEKQGKTMRISFRNTYSGLKVRDKYGFVKGFAIAGSDKKFQWAEAKLEGNQILLSSASIPDPQFVRYGWANNPDDVNVYNSADLPLIPFRTDQ